MYNSVALDTMQSSQSGQRGLRMARSSTKLNITKVFDIVLPEEEVNPLKVIEEKNIENVLIKHWMDSKLIQIHMVFSEDLEAAVPLDNLGFLKEDKEEEKSENSQHNMLTEDDLSLDKNDMGEPQ